MNHLTREVRFALNQPGEIAGRQGQKNSWSSWPRMVGVRPFIKLQATVSGQPDPATGYLCDIKLMDGLIQDQVVDAMANAYENGEVHPARLLKSAWDNLQQHFPTSLDLTSLRLIPHPNLSFLIQKAFPGMVSTTQQFEFSASHRLHCKELSDDENRKLFGKCNHPNGHGHNYVIDVTIRQDLETPSANGVENISDLESVVATHVIDRFDHKHLNLDIEEFSETNPTVENIARVIWEILKDRIRDELVNVRVYETPKTWADYCAS